jgi:hypothetical protein
MMLIEVKLVYNAMESFKEKVPPICLGLLKLFLIEKKKRTLSMHCPPFFIHVNG